MEDVNAVNTVDQVILEEAPLPDILVSERKKQSSRQHYQSSGFDNVTSLKTNTGTILKEDESSLL